MKKIVLALFTIALFACKDDKKKAVEPNVLEEKKEVLTSVKFPAYPAWEKNGIDITESSDSYLGQEALTLSRSQEDTKSSYAYTGKIPVTPAEIYRVSVIAKKGTNSNLFGMRIAGIYPALVNAVFNLENGTVKGVQKTGDFDYENAKIEDLGEGWFKCIVSAKVAADTISIFLGPTKGVKQVNTWTFRTPDACDAHVIPMSLTLEKGFIE